MSQIQTMTEKELVSHIEQRLDRLNANMTHHSWEESLSALRSESPHLDLQWLEKGIERWWELNP